MKDLMLKIKCFLDNEKGQGLVEYALILVLIAIVVIVMLSGVGGQVNTTFSAINSVLDANNP